MVVIKIGMELYFEFINYRFASKIHYIYIVYKPKILSVSYILKGLQLECSKTAFCYSPFWLIIQTFF